MHSRSFSHQSLSGIKYHKSISSSQLSAQSQSAEIYLSGLIKCPLCEGRIKQAQMCPSCCKLFCHNCIREWVLSKKSECPSCVRPLHYSSIVNCDLLGKQISELFEAKTMSSQQTPPVNDSPSFNKQLTPNYSTPDLMNPSSPCSPHSQCIEHTLPFEYFCQNCCEGICSDCAILTTKHVGHKLCKLSSKRTSFHNMVKQIKTKLSAQKEIIKQNLQYNTQQLLASRSMETQKLSTLMGYLKRFKENTSQKLEKTIKIEEQSQRQYRKEFQDSLARCYVLEKEIQTPVKTRLIVEAKGYEETMNFFLNAEEKQTKCKKCQSNLLAPQFDRKVFILDNYTHLKGKDDVLYSEPFFWKNIQWKLKIFPGGLKTNPQSEQNLAMYLEMTKGHKNHRNLYSCRIQLINQGNREKAISKTFQNWFSQGTSWGYDSFINIATLYEEKYVHPEEDYLEIILHVKAPTYYHAVRDQDYEISTKEEIKTRNLEKLLFLRNQVKQKSTKVFEKQKKNISTALTDPAIDLRGTLKKVKSHTIISSSLKSI